MKKTKDRDDLIPIEYRITVSTETLAAMLDCGRATAMKIGTDAGAKIKAGQRTLWNVNVIRRYIDEHTEKTVE